MDTLAFLKSVVTTEEGWFELLVGPPDGTGWHEEWFRWPDDSARIVARGLEAAKTANVYFTAHLFDSKDSHKNHVLPTRTIQCDLDEAVSPTSGTVPIPSVLVETSPGRHQAYWVLNESLDATTLEGISRFVTYNIPDADHSGWSLGHKMRLPGTLNYKYSSGAKSVKVVSSPLITYKPFASGEPPVQATNDNWEPSPLSIGVRELWAGVKIALPRKIAMGYDRVQQDRSAYMWSLMLALFRLDADRNEVYWLCKESANNKFKDHRMHGDMDLIKDILRAERSISSGATDDQDIKTKIIEARRLPGLSTERRAYIADLVRDYLGSQGNFVATSDGQEWFIREDTGRPIPLTRNNDYLNSLLEVKCGLNATEADTKYVINSLIATTKDHGTPGVTASLSRYDRSSDRLLIHTGRRDVLVVNAREVSTVANGNFGVVFPWRVNEEPFEPVFGQGGPAILDELFAGCFDNLDELEPRHALALLRSWLVFLLLRDDAIGRPILALFGQPGSGKSTLFRRIYAFIYGPAKAINSVTSSDDFDHSVSIDPLVVFDNVDTWVTWLPDKLALSAAASDLVKRKLYTDSDTVVLRRQALVGLTAHNPKFRREDIVDRLVMLNFHRLKDFKPETEILQRILNNRDRYWGALIEAAQSTLAQSNPAETDIPRFRVNDFARLGLRAARAMGYEQDFVEALRLNATEQVSFNLEEEDVLVDTIRGWLRTAHSSNKPYFSSGELWTSWSALARDPLAFQRFYRNAVGLGKKLWSLQETLSAIFNVEYKMDEVTRTRVWRFTLK